MIRNGDEPDDLGNFQAYHIFSIRMMPDCKKMPPGT